MTKRELKELIKEAIGEIDSANDTPSIYDVAILNNFYNGKYADYSARYYPVLATNEEEAKKVVLNNADAILQDLLSRKLLSGRNVLPKNSALPITNKRIGHIRKNTGRTSNGYKKIFSLNGVVFAKYVNGVVQDFYSKDGNSYRKEQAYEGYATDRGRKSAKDRIIRLKAEYDRIRKLKRDEDYVYNNDPQARNFHDRRLKEIPKEISKIRQKILDINESSEVDMTGKTCEKCKRGKYGERSQQDDMDGKVTCDKCKNRVDRWRSH